MGKIVEFLGIMQQRRKRLFCTFTTAIHNQAKNDRTLVYKNIR
ncbi:hypothetical protein AC062_1703 [Pasteurellaceae bacterium NI1060]|nr:hypothetical protein AC062_1703 [Pasteurellaceae bacterium NI1060]